MYSASEETGLFLSVLGIFQPDSRSSKNLLNPQIQSGHFISLSVSLFSLLRGMVGSRECGRGLSIPAVALLRLSGSKDGSSWRPMSNPYQVTGLLQLPSHLPEV